MDALEAPLPPEKLPSCWDDDTRMNALFAPCKHISIAPEAWRQKMTFWSEQLRALCRHRRCPLLSVSAARRAFTRNKNRPACMDVVLEEYVRNGEYVPISTYTQALSNSGEGWVKWGARLAFKPASLAVGLLTSYLPFDKTPHDGMATASIDHDQLYANTVIVKELASELINSIPEDSERVGTLDELMETTGYSVAERQTFEVILGYMMTAGLAVRKGDLYKLADAGASKATPVTECEEALHRLLAAERRLCADADRLRAEEERALVETRRALKQGAKAQAKAHLRRKHRLAERAAGSEAALDNVRQLLLEMKQAEMNSSIVDTYKLSVGAMKKVMKEENLDEDTAHDTMEELREVLESYGEVEKSLAGKLDDYDAAELEDELEVLLASDPKDNAPGGSPRQNKEIPGAAKRKPKVSEREFVFDGEARMMAELNELSLPDTEPDQDSPEREREKVAVALAEREKETADAARRKEKRAETVKPTKPWYPPAEQSLECDRPGRTDAAWSLHKIEDVESMRTDYLLDALSNSTREIRMDPRLHPGQKLEVNSSGRVLYNTDFLVQDHKLDDGVWLFNPNDDSDSNRPYDNSNRQCDNPNRQFDNQNRQFDNTNRQFDNTNRQFDNANQQFDNKRTYRKAKSQTFDNSTEYADDSNENREFEMAPGGERVRKDESNLEDLERRLKNLRSFK